MKTKKQTNYLDSRTKEEKKNEPIGSTCDDTVFIEGKKQTKDWEKEFIKEFIDKGNTDNSWFWKTKRHHPFAIVDFIRKTRQEALQVQKEEIIKMIEEMKKIPPKKNNIPLDWGIEDSEDEFIRKGYNKAIQELTLKLNQL